MSGTVCEDVMPVATRRCTRSQSRFRSLDVGGEMPVSVASTEWTAEEEKTLIKKVLCRLTINDIMGYRKRLNMVNWNVCALKHREPHECKEKMEEIIAKIRKNRTLPEILSELLWHERQKRKDWDEIGGDHPNFEPRKRIKLIPSTPAELTVDENIVIPVYGRKGTKMPRRRIAKYFSNFPKDPQTPYEIYVSERRENNRLKLTGTEALKAYRSAWLGLPDTEMLEYIDKSMMDHQRYQVEMDEFIAENPDIRMDKQRLLLNPLERNLLFHRSVSQNAFHPEAYPGATSGHKLYIMEQETKHIKSAGWLTLVNRKWQEMCTYEKEEYQIRIRAMWKQYESAAQHFIDQCAEDMRDSMRDKIRKTPKTLDNKPLKTVAGENAKENILNPAESKAVEAVGDKKQKKPDFSGCSYFVSQNELEYLAHCPFSTIDDVRKKLRKIYKKLPLARQELYIAKARSSGNIY
ncbi:uncharacterized protein LOC129581582 [Paramacrobiotus metropolitanus]|uniref:uncharacterized protein LOC129581582 n=1 Tax=Paramacrobiotus metropolitanus TaxID=2943436 RepID=UPI002445975A|nr:uncharacterized protein LOC129581582 [Paramacrobiotus metropolitanus]XP_055328723.1 uncharacterized protein LOC129581582 [Paramacrobiotus metropolitanus]XP_055328724.1 uncharacterized protein LOC129581582 [Paramacrobiotus metropolitanus]